MLTSIELFVPSVLAVLAIVLYTEHTKGLCYVLVSLCIVAELIPMTINTVGLATTIAAMGALLLLEFRPKFVHWTQKPKSAAHKAGSEEMHSF